MSLGPASQIELEGDEVRFLAPFAGQWPSEYWLRAFRQAQLVWPSHLVEPRLDEGRGLQLGPLPVAALEEHVRAAKEQVAAANRIYFDEIEPELRRQRDEAHRREQEEHRLQADVESKLKHLLSADLDEAVPGGSSDRDESPGPPRAAQPGLRLLRVNLPLPLTPSRGGRLPRRRSNPRRRQRRSTTGSGRDTACRRCP